MTTLNLLRRCAALMLALLCAGAQAGMGMTQLPATAQDPLVTVYYPSSGADQPFELGPMTLQLAKQGTPMRGNGRMVVISHGTAGSPWAFADLARSLVHAGFVVALPEHLADNYKDSSEAGPVSFARRPAEVSRAIDAVARDARLGPLLDTDKVGVFGNSAGGHTVLSLAGGMWSAAGFLHHCEAHLAEDFHACTGLITRLDGGVLDGLKKWLAMAVLRHRFDDATPLSYADPRIAAAAASVPWAADFDMATLAQARIPLGLVTVGQDRWLQPRFHSDRVLQACKDCELIAALPTAGHGAMLSPLPPVFTGLVGEILNDPPGFDRAETAKTIDKITAFFGRHLLPVAVARSAERSQP